MPKLLLPLLRLTAWMAIAAALVYLAFFKSEPKESADGHQPSVAMTSPTVVASRGPVTNQVSLSGSLTAQPATVVKSTAGGTVGTVKTQVGATVAEGDVLFTVKVPVAEPAPTPSTDDPAASSAPTAPATPKYTVKNVTATTPGTVATLDVLPDQEVQIGTAAASINGGKISAQAQLTSENQYRLPVIPTAATISVNGGPAPFACTDLHVLTPTAGTTGTDAGATDPAGGSPSGGGVTLQCSVPAGTPVYAGSAATLLIDAGSVPDAVVLPVTAVDGKVTPGRVWVAGEDGEPVETQVELGITDGVMIEIKSGIAEGTEVLEFTPQQQTQPMEQPGGQGGEYGGYGG